MVNINHQTTNLKAYTLINHYMLAYLAHHGVRLDFSDETMVNLKRDPAKLIFPYQDDISVPQSTSPDNRQLIVEIDKNWNFGYANNSLIIKTENHELFTNANLSKPENLSAILENTFAGVIAHFILQGYEKLPADNLTIGVPLHTGGHVTLLLVKFEKMNSSHYQALYNSYNKSDIKFDNLVEELKTKNPNRLPVSVEKVTLTHYDSINGKHYERAARNACASFINLHQATFIQGECSQQEGQTCGTWFAFNSLYYGVLNKKSRVNRNTIELHTLSEKIKNDWPNKKLISSQLVQEASQILFNKAKPSASVNHQGVQQVKKKTEFNFALFLCIPLIGLLALYFLPAYSFAIIGATVFFEILNASVYLKNCLVQKWVKTEVKKDPHYSQNSWSATAYQYGQASQKSYLTYFQSCLDPRAICRPEAYYLGKHDSQKNIPANSRLKVGI